MTLDSDPPEPPKWLSERGREEIEHVEPPAAWALSFFFGGGGQLLVRDYRTGVALVLADILAIATLPALAGFSIWLAIGTVSSILAIRQAWAVNRFTTARILRQQALKPPLAALDAVSRAAAEQPSSALGERAERLSKLADLRRAGVLSAVEHRERKVEILAELGEVGLEHREDLLHDLLQLRARGVVDDDDLQFVKDLGA